MVSIVDRRFYYGRIDYSGRGELPDQEEKLNQRLKRLAGLSEEVGSRYSSQSGESLTPSSL